MANNYYDGTGILILDRVTPIITALFGEFNLDATYPGNGSVYISLIAETNSPGWDSITCNLLDLAEQLDIEIDDADDPKIEAVLDAFATFFRGQDNDDLANLIEHHGFEHEADIDALFIIASCFNDGHNLKAIAFEGCWRCDKPRLFEFGGNGHFISREVDLSGNSSRVIEIGRELQQALVDGDVEIASAVVAAETTRLLAAVTDHTVRETLRARVAERLSIG